MSRYVIVGAGALGGLLAAQLQQAGRDVVLVARGSNLDAIRAKGITVHRPDSTDVVRVTAVGGPEDLTLTFDDVIVLATKTQDTEAALQHWAWQQVSGGGLAADLPVITLHNGLAAEDLALRRFSRVYGASMWIAASYLTPGEIVSPSWPLVGIVWIGNIAPGQHPTTSVHEIDSVVQDLNSAGYYAESVADIRGVKAHKLLGNLANALDLFDGPSEQLEAARGAIVDEAKAVYAAAGIVPVDPSAAAGVGYSTLGIRPVPGQINGKRSTWQSFARGSSSEIDFLNGEIVLLGRIHGVPTRVNERAQRVLGALATTGGGAEPRDISLLFD